jgi:hypothetical protein
MRLFAAKTMPSWVPNWFPGSCGADDTLRSGMNAGTSNASVASKTNSSGRTEYQYFRSINFGIKKHPPFEMSG